VLLLREISRTPFPQRKNRHRALIFGVAMTIASQAGRMLHQLHPEWAADSPVDDVGWIEHNL